MYCSRCGNKLNKRTKFCGVCGAPNPLFQNRIKAKWPRLILPLLILAAAAVVVIVIKIAKSPVENGNLSNLGLAYNDGKNLYFDADGFLDYDNDQVSNLLQVHIDGDTYSTSIASAGNFIYLTKFQGKVYCVESGLETPSHLVRFDDLNGEREILFPELSVLKVYGVINDQFYFTVLEDVYDESLHEHVSHQKLYHITSEGDLVLDNAIDPLFVSSRGIYKWVDEESMTGLKLVDENNNTIHIFDSLNGYKTTNVCFERKGYLYLFSYEQPNYPGEITTATKILRLDIESDTITSISDKLILNQGLQNMQNSGFTYYNDTLYYVFTSTVTNNDEDVLTFSSDLDGNNIRYISRGPTYSNAWRVNSLDENHLVLRNIWSYEWFILDVERGIFLREE